MFAWDILEPRWLMAFTPLPGNGAVPWALPPVALGGPAETPPPPAQGGFAVSASQAGTTGLDLSWNSPAVLDPAGIQGYRVRYIAGDYLPGPAGEAHTVDVPASATSAPLSGLEPFTLYSVDVTALGPGGAALRAAHVNAWTAQPATLQRYLYVMDLPKQRQGFETLAPQIEVFDVNNGHQWVKNIPLPSGIYNVRGSCA